jgi:hypothetical protein
MKEIYGYNTLQTFYPTFFTLKGIPLDYIKTFFSLLLATLYFMFNMQ